jgi:tetratricopeptide (TPR) repeat protein
VQKTSRFNEGREWTDSAVAMARQALSLDSTLAKAHKALGVGYSVQGSHRDALMALERAVELNPNLASAIGNLGGLYVAKGRYDEGLRWQRRAQALQPTAQAQLLSNIAAIYTWLGAFERAEAELRQALVLRPDFVPPRLVRTYLSLRQGKLPQAVELAEGLVRDDPGDAAFRTAAGEAYLLLGRLPACEGALRGSVRTFSRWADPALGPRCAAATRVYAAEDRRT